MQVVISLDLEYQFPAIATQNTKARSCRILWPRCDFSIAKKKRVALHNCLLANMNEGELLTRKPVVVQQWLGKQW